MARAYGAVCTPDFFGYDAERKLRYRGRLDEGRTTQPSPNARRELFDAMCAIATGGGAGRSDPVGRLLHQVEGRLASTPLMADHPWTSPLSTASRF